MKAISSIAVCLWLTASAVSAQSITITKANMPSSGEEYIYSTTTDKVDVSITGANQAWDFSGLTPISQDTMKFKKPQEVNVAFLLSFFGDVAVQQPNGALKNYYGFFKTGAGAYVQQGAGFTLPVVNIPLPIQYTSPDVVYRFPLTYGNKKDSSKYELNNNFQGITLAVHGKRVNTVDGYGTITTPYKSFSCIRVKSEITEFDTLGGIPIDNSRTEYKWLSTDEKVPVMQVIEWPVLGTVTIYRDIHRDIINPVAPQVDFSADKTTVETGDTVSFTNNTTPPMANYTWSISPSSFMFVRNTKASSSAPALVFTQAGQYDVSLSASNPFGSNSLSKAKYITVSNRTSIAVNQQNPNGITIYPNPTGGSIYISSNIAAEGSMLQWQLFDITGRNILKGKLKNTTGAAIDLSNCPDGVYYLQLDKGTMQKLLIQKR
jgi:PKD repeat protein